MEFRNFESHLHAQFRVKVRQRLIEQETLGFRTIARPIETRQSRPGRELVLERLLEVLLIEALRCGADTASAPSVARGLSDNRLVAALRAVHAQPGHGWTVADLAAEAAMSRSAFFARFTRVVGLPPMEYLIAWRMALAKRLLRSRDYGIEQVAARVGYGSASTFSTAFARHVGMSPMRCARGLIAP
jgi:AraC-like DNA-binding protein